MSKKANNKKYRDKYVSSYYFLKKPYLLREKNYIAVKKTSSLIRYKIISQNEDNIKFLNRDYRLLN